MRKEGTQLPELLILAGGFGTRLRSAVADVPKPLAPVGGRPFLHYLMESWYGLGIKNMTFLLYHQAEMIEDFLSTQPITDSFRGCRFRTITEPEPLGTGGAIAYAVHQLNIADEFLTCNADTWLGSSSGRMLGVEGPAMAVVRISNADRYGNVLINEGKVSSFEEKTGVSGPGLINAGLYRLQPDLFDQWDGDAFSLERTMLPALVADNRLLAVELEDEFIDIGVPDDYFRFCRWIDAGKAGKL